MTYKDTQNCWTLFSREVIVDLKLNLSTKHHLQAQWIQQNLKAQLGHLRQRLLPHRAKEELVKECSSYLAERLTARGNCNRLFSSCVSDRGPFCYNSFPGLEIGGSELTNQQILSAWLCVRIPVQTWSLQGCLCLEELPFCKQRSVNCRLHMEVEKTYSVIRVDKLSKKITPVMSWRTTIFCLHVSVTTQCLEGCPDTSNLKDADI